MYSFTCKIISQRQSHTQVATMFFFLVLTEVFQKKGENVSGARSSRKKERSPGAQNLLCAYITAESNTLQKREKKNSQHNARLFFRKV